MCSNTGCNLHLIEPLGFSLDDKKLRRAGLDYREYCEIRTHENWENFVETCKPARIFAISTKGRMPYTEAKFLPGDYLLFGPETRGLPEDILASKVLSGVLRIPMLAHSRSLNLSNAAAVLVYEAWRQQAFSGA